MTKKVTQRKNLKESGHSFPGFATDKESYVQGAHPSALVAYLRELGQFTEPFRAPTFLSWHLTLAVNFLAQLMSKLPADRK